MPLVELLVTAGAIAAVAALARGFFDWASARHRADRRAILGRVVAPAVATTAVLLVAGCGQASSPAPGSAEQLAAGKAAFAVCAVCHGKDLRGTAMGPPFLSPIYAPDHHPDAAFRTAVANGVVPHHWNFGPMPPLPEVSEAEVEAIIAYVRDQQRRAGITDDPTH